MVDDVADIICQVLPCTQEARVYNVMDDVADIICQALPFTRGTRVYNVEDDVAGTICPALERGHDAPRRLHRVLQLALQVDRR